MDEIRRHITKRVRRNAISRCYHARDNKEAILTWKLDLEGILGAQGSCTEAKSQSAELHKEDARLKNEARSLGSTERTQPHPDGFSQIPYPSPSLWSTQSQLLASPIFPSHVSRYPDQNMSHHYSVARDADRRWYALPRHRH